jgi:transglutaminase-like putative cysteine protease
MRIRIDHRTTYRYDAPASGLVQALRVTPTEHAGQHVIDWRVDADIDGSFRESRDAFGNKVTMFYANGPLNEVTLIVTGIVDVGDTAGVIQAEETLPPATYLRPTDLTRPDDGIAALAGSFATEAPLAALHGLCAAIYGRMRFEVGLTNTGTSARAALAEGHGVCQDFAHIFIAAARWLGFPARYVSGHLVREEAQEAAHAWAEAHVPELGWVGFDPANGISPTDHYVRVAIGLDYLDAAPIRGSRRGGGGESLSVSVDAAAAMRQSQA